nr:hypothetical protein [Tanacetum cinerariifolium]
VDFAGAVFRTVVKAVDLPRGAWHRRQQIMSLVSHGQVLVRRAEEGQPAAFGQAEQAHQYKGDREVDQRGDAERLERQKGGRVRIACNLEDVRHGGGEGHGGRVQHQDHFVAVVRQRPTQGRRHDNVGVEAPAGQAICLRRFDFAVVHAANRTGEDLGGVRAGVEGERQNGAVHRVTEERAQHGLFTHGGDAVDAGVADQQLDIERRATEQRKAHHLREHHEAEALSTAQAIGGGGFDLSTWHREDRAAEGALKQQRAEALEAERGQSQVLQESFEHVEPIQSIKTPTVFRGGIRMNL